MPRPIWKGPFVARLTPTSTLPQAHRSSTILPSHVGKSFLVHNGKSLKQITVQESMVARKFGEFAYTRIPFSFRKRDDARKR